jgi:hypothetical protein
MNMEELIKRELEGETDILRENLPQCHLIHYKSHMTWDGTRAVAIRIPRLTASTVVRPN